ncbi:MAG: divalent-cation tolerance protein CutA [archaeon]|nr:divalent-cation tolerance protein CutA [Nanoarchaeota archaeon]
MIIIYATFANREEAQKIANHLLKEKLIACANFSDVNACFNWKNKRNNVKETTALMKTRDENWDKVKEEIKNLHSYDTPCIIKINAEANKAFEDWVNKETEEE